jgi:hypothetical protein
MPESSCASPIVTTIRIRRGAFLNRRTITNSTREPSATPTTSAIGTATQNDSPMIGSVIKDTARLAGTAPRSAWAKLMTLLAR